ncbi:hypothetical protein BX616_005878, partial [Lobosporangium transversale]
MHPPSYQCHESRSDHTVVPPEKIRIPEDQLDYSHEPTWDQSNLLVHCDKPFNAEPSLPALINAGEITPTEIFFKRNHGPIPDISQIQHRVYIGLQDGERHQGINWQSLSMNDIMTRWPKVTVTATLQCAGNRRDGLAAVKEVKGVIWKSAAVSTAIWSGAQLCDILNDVAGISAEHHNKMIRDYHVCFEANDHVHEDVCYGSSIPLRKA